jgi:hypothetical protein
MNYAERLHAVYLDLIALGWSHDAALELAEIHIRMKEQQ